MLFPSKQLGHDASWFSRLQEGNAAGQRFISKSGFLGSGCGVKASWYRSGQSCNPGGQALATERTFPPVTCWQPFEQRSPGRPYPSGLKHLGGGDSNTSSASSNPRVRSTPSSPSLLLSLPDLSHPDPGRGRSRSSGAAGTGQASGASLCPPRTSGCCARAARTNAPPVIDGRPGSASHTSRTSLGGWKAGVVQNLPPPSLVHSDRGGRPSDPSSRTSPSARTTKGSSPDGPTRPSTRPPSSSQS
mmetsp:Transcript_4347/g.9659  ORF Transcript_4347/g.9659 Transcript_4347/m.9659 type:complete len:245 (-) Transcript_4347:470-1204(-)